MRLPVDDSHTINRQTAAEIAQRCSDSVLFDWCPYPHDVNGCIAHARALAWAGLITAGP
jgi:argininosuccinate lyase